MADESATDRIKVRHKTTLAETDIARSALPFFPDYEQINEPEPQAEAKSPAGSKSKES